MTGDACGVQAVPVSEEYATRDRERSTTMNDHGAVDAAAAARHARFGKLPERIRYEDMTEEKEAAPTGGPASYNPEGAWNYYSCLALDLGL